MANFRRGAEAVQAAATKGGGSGKFKPIFFFESGETKYVQFLTSMDEVPTVLMHQWIIVGKFENGDPKYERFISRTDPGLDGEDGYDELIERFGCKPTERCVAVAVELEPQFKQVGKRKVIDGFEIATRTYEKDDEEITVPNVALVIESPYTLFGTLSSLNEIKPLEDYVWAIKVEGKGKDKNFAATDVAEAIDFEDELDEFLDEIDFEGYLDELADEDRMRELIGDLPDDWVVNKYAKKGKGKGGSKSESKSRTTRSRRVRNEEPDEPEADESEAEEQEDKPARKRRFGDLKRDLSEKKDD